MSLTTETIPSADPSGINYTNELQGDTSPKKSRTWLWYASAAIVAVALLGVGIKIAGGSSDPGEGAATAAGPQTTAVAWQGAALPVNQEHGPTNLTATRATGFSQTELGAALAAVWVSTHIDPFTSPQVFTPAATEQTVGNTAALLDQLNQAYAKAAKEAKVADGAPIIAPTGAIDAWRIDQFDPAAVNNVELYVTAPDGKDWVYTIPVRWVDGDWKIDPVADDGTVTFEYSDPDPETDYHRFVSMGS